jgi:hypothetical protein
VGKPIAYLNEPTDFSLVQGGPLFQLLLRAGLIRPSMDLVARRIIVISLVAWLPLLVLTLLSGVGGLGVLFMTSVHTRFSCACRSLLPRR